MFFNRNQHCEMLERLIHIEGKIDRIEKSTIPIYNKFLGGGYGKTRLFRKIHYKVLRTVW